MSAILGLMGSDTVSQETKDVSCFERIYVDYGKEEWKRRCGGVLGQVYGPLAKCSCCFWIECEQQSGKFMRNQAFLMVNCSPWAIEEIAT